MRRRVLGRRRRLHLGLAELLTRRLALAVSTVIIGAGCAGDAAPAPIAIDDATVVATVGDVEVTVGSVRAWLPEEPPIWPPGAARPEPARDALDAAIRAALFAAEAEARGLVHADTDSLVSPEALGMQALLTEERSEHAFSAEAVSEEDARADYAARPDYYDEIEAATVTYVHVADIAGTASLLDSVAGASASGFASTAEEHGTPQSRQVDSTGDGVPVPVARIVFGLREVGAVAGVPADEGGFYVARIETLEFHRSVWDAALSTKVRTALAWQREQAHLEQLGDQLREDADVRLDDASVAAFVATVGWGPAGGH